MSKGRHSSGKILDSLSSGTTPSLSRVCSWILPSYLCRQLLSNYPGTDYLLRKRPILQNGTFKLLSV